MAAAIGDGCVGVGEASSGRDSPKMTERVFSSRPIRSRITLLVIRCQNDSLGRSSSLLTVSGSSWITDSCLIITAAAASSCILDRISIDPAVPLILLIRRLRRLVSFSISSKTARLCSSLHFSIRVVRSSSTSISCSSSIASSFFCTLLRRRTCRLRCGLYRSNCHSCSCSPAVDGNVPKPSCVGSTVPPL